MFADTLDENYLDKTNPYPSDGKFKFGSGMILKTWFCMEIPVVLALGNVVIKFDGAGNDLPFLLGKKNLEKWNLQINIGNNTAKLTFNNVSKELGLYTSDNGQHCLNIQLGFPSETVHVLFSII